MKSIIALALLLGLPRATASPQKLVTLLDQVHEAQAYWEIMARDKKLGFWKRPPHRWLSPSWRSEVANHRTELAHCRTELTEALGNLYDSPYALSGEETSRLHNRISKILRNHASPSHFDRRWLSYAALAATAVAWGIYLHHFKHSRIHFVLPPGSPSLRSALADYTPFAEHDYVAKEGTGEKQHLQVKKQSEGAARAFLADNSCTTYREETPEFSLCWYNSQGEHKFTEFIRVHGIEPLRKMYHLLRNDIAPKANIFTTNEGFNEKLLRDTQTRTLQKALETPQTAYIIQEELHGRSLEILEPHEKRKIFMRLMSEQGTIFSTLLADVSAMLVKAREKNPLTKHEKFVPWSNPGRNPEAIRTVIRDINIGMERLDHFTEKGEKLATEAQIYVDFLRELAEKVTPLLEMTPQLYNTKFLELQVQLATIMHLVNEHAQSAQLNLELSTMLPLVLVSYGGYSLARALYRHATALTILTPLKTDLLSLQLILNKERYAKDCATLSLTCKGECFYRIQRLGRYKDKLPSAYRSVYRQYLDELKDPNLLPEQKITVARCLFKELEPLFKKV